MVSGKVRALNLLSVTLSVVAGDGNLGLDYLSKDYLENESLLIGRLVVEESVVEIVAPPLAYSKVVRLGLKTPAGGLLNGIDEPPGFSFSYLFKYVIRFSFDFRDSCASTSLDLSVPLIDFRSVISTFRSSVSLRLLTDSLIRSSIFCVFSFIFTSIV